MSDKINYNNTFSSKRPLEFNSEMKVLNNLESVHQRKKAAFDELLRYTYSNLKEANTEHHDNNQS